MASELIFHRNQSSKSVIKRNEVVERMGVIPMTTGQRGPFGEVIYAGIQVFLHSDNVQPRGVKVHREDAGVYEIYFPLIGNFQVTRGQEGQTLMGNLTPSDTKGAEYRIQYDERSNECVLEVRNGEKRSDPIVGFVIPGDTDHSTQQLDNSLTSFLAIKIDSNKRF